MLRRTARWTALIGALGVVSGCKGDATGAAVTAGAAVAGAGIYRATTGGCVAQCLGGLVCDRKSGLCVSRVPCNGRCDADEQCEEGAVPRCVPMFPITSTSSSDAGRDAH